MSDSGRSRVRADTLGLPRATDVVGRFVRPRALAAGRPRRVDRLYCMYTHNTCIFDTRRRDNVAVSRVRVYNIIAVRAHTHTNTRARIRNRMMVVPRTRRDALPVFNAIWFCFFFFSVVGGGRRRGVGRPDGVCRRTAAGRPRATAVVRLTSNTSRTRSPASFNIYAHRRRQQVVRPFP